MYLQELSSRGEEGLEVPSSAIATLESLAEQTQLQLHGKMMSLLAHIHPPFAMLTSIR